MKDCGCIKGSVGLIQDKIIGSVEVATSHIAASVGVWASDVAGSVKIISDMVIGCADVIHNQIIGQVGIICMPSTELFIKVTPEMVWLTADMLSDGEFIVASNTDWIIEQ